MAVLLLAAAGCGSTVQGSSVASGDDSGLTVQNPGAALITSSGDPGLSPSGTVGSGNPQATRTQPGLTRGVPVGGSQPEAGQPRGASGANAPGKGTSSSGSGKAIPGIEKGHVKLGFIVIRNGDAAGQAVGIPVGYGDQDAYVDAIVANMNKHGGLAGLPVTAVKAVLDGSTTDYATWAESVCQQFTNDDRIFALLTGGRFMAYSIPACLEAKQIPVITAGVSTTDDLTMSQSNFFVDAADPNLTRQAALLVDDMVQRKVLTPQSTIGLIRYDCINYQRAADRGFKPALKRHNLKAPIEATVKCLDAGASEIAAAVLKFNAAHVTHVALLEQGGLMSILFMRNADGQNYRPRYMLTSQNDPDLIAADVPVSQLQSAVGAGWLPALDNGAYFTQAPHASDCAKIYSSAGLSNNPCFRRSGVLLGCGHRAGCSSRIVQY